MELIETLQARVASAAGYGKVQSPFDLKFPAKRRISAAAREKIAAGARVKWAASKRPVATRSKRLAAKTKVG